MRTIPEIINQLQWYRLEHGADSLLSRGNKFVIKTKVKDTIPSGAVLLHIDSPGSNYENKYHLLTSEVNLSLADHFASEVAAMRTDIKYRVSYSQVLQDLVVQWVGKGRRSKLNALADEVWTNSIEYLNGVRRMVELLDGKVPQIWLAICPNNEVLSFRTETEEEAASRFEVLTPKKEAATPAKVLAKMTAARIDKLHTAVLDFNIGILRDIKRFEEETENAKKAAAAGITTRHTIYNPFGVPKDRELIEVRDMDSMAAIQGYRQALVGRSNGYRSYSIERFTSELEEITHRPLFSDEVMKEAWHVFVMKDVHRS